MPALTLPVTDLRTELQSKLGAGYNFERELGGGVGRGAVLHDAYVTGESRRALMVNGTPLSTADALNVLRDVARAGLCAWAGRDPSRHQAR